MLNPFHELGAKVNRTVRAVILACAAGAAGVTAVFFFSLGAFLWLRETYGTINASLALGGSYALIAAAVVIAMLLVRRRAAEKEAAAQAAQKAAPQWWSDPMLLTAGIEVLRVVGRRKMLPLTIAAVLAGFALSGALSSRQGSPPPRAKPNGSGTFPDAGH